MTLQATNRISKKGFIDLSSWDFEKKGHIEVRGEWKFYPNKIINPEKDKVIDAVVELS